jgi:cytochrome b6-f complex iron-sulfur subunit
MSPKNHAITAMHMSVLPPSCHDVGDASMSENRNREEPNAAEPSVFLTRRQFIQLGMAGVGAAWAGTFVQTRLFTQGSSQDASPVSFLLSELPVGASKIVTYAGGSVIVVRTAVSIKAFSLVCTHLGCLVQWQPENMEFYCPCHDGRFDQFGEVIAGPPPVPLEEIAVSVDGDRVVVGEVV